jgi:probable phosphoglycerate mutase
MNEKAGPGSGSAFGVPEATPTVPAPPALILVRHGETAWSRTGQHTGRTDLELTEVGLIQARTAGRTVRVLLGGHRPAAVLSSPRRRALHTAQLAGFTDITITDAAAEWDYGELEGQTSAEIRRRFPGWSIWDGPVPGGEDAAAVTARFDRLLRQVAEAGNVDGNGEGASHREPVVVFSHGHAIRCIAARWLCEPVTAGRQFALGTGAVCCLDFEHDSPVVQRWNLDAAIEGPGAT